MSWNPFAKHKQEITRLTTLNQDMDGQIRELLTRHALTDTQWAEYERNMAQHREMAVEQGNIIAYLRGQFPEDFTGGLRNMSFSQIVVSYLKSAKLQRLLSRD